MNYVEIKTRDGAIMRHPAIGMAGFRTACIYAKAYRDAGKAKVYPNGEGWKIKLLSGEEIATVMPI